MTHIVKRKGHTEPFDERKLYASIYAACLSSHILDEEAESISNLVTREIKDWLKEKDKVTSKEIFNQAEAEMKHLNKIAAFMYKTHRDIS